VTDFDYLFKDYYKNKTIVPAYVGVQPEGYPAIDKLGVNQTYRFADSQKSGFSLDATKTKLAYGTPYADA
ncbi:hypothetical protein, partial [uncultured Duncaniella sp.]